MSFGSAIALVQKFASRSGASAFPGLGVSRSTFAMDLMDHINSPSSIQQQNSSLCGPAVFLYSLLTKTPETYAQFVIDLYEKGHAKIGQLEVKPSTDCKNYRVPAASGRAITPVDWVSLASLRDGSNVWFDYQDPSDDASGITMPSGLAGWFKNSWKFTEVHNQTNIFLNCDLHTLVQAHQKYCAGHKVCLFIGANVLEGADGGTMVPDHWVVLSSQIWINGSLATNLARLGKTVNDEDELYDSSIEFTVCTWGAPSRGIDDKWPDLTVRDFLNYFYGFVSAK